MDKILVTRSSMPPMEEYMEEIKGLWDSHWLTNMGEKHQKLAKALEEYLGVEKLLLFTNGHNALELALQGLDLPKGREVITTPFTFASTTHAIVRNGFKPVFCDIREDNYTIDERKIEALITDQTVAIVPVHVYGNLCAVEEIQKIADRHHLKVIYDAAHAFGVRKDGKGVGSFGDASMFSFHATKVFNTVEGGAICLHDPALELTLERLKNFGIRNEEEVSFVDSNAKMNEFCAAMGLCNLRHVDEEIAKRGQVVSRYRAHLAEISGIGLNAEQEGVKPNYAYFPIRINASQFGASRDALYEALKEYGIFTRKYFYPITNSFACYEGRFDVHETPKALQISTEILTLPLYADLPLEDVDRICAAIKEIGQRKRS